MHAAIVAAGASALIGVDAASADALIAGSDMLFDDLSLAEGAVLKANVLRIFVRGTLTMGTESQISNDGASFPTGAPSGTIGGGVVVVISQSPKPSSLTLGALNPFIGEDGRTVDLGR